jgi:metallo-beta-lactamase domain protein
MTKYSMGGWEDITPHVSVTSLQPHGVTVGLVSGEQQAVLIDAGSSPEQGGELLEQARALSPVPVTHVVVTHPHHDHWFGTAGMTDVSVIAHEDLLKHVEPEVLAAAESIGLSQLPRPRETFSLVSSLDLGGVRIEMLHFGAAHTNADLVVLVPDQDVVFMGDLIESAGDPQFGPSSDAGNWPRVLDNVLGATTESMRFVPGHGRPGDSTGGFVVDREFCFRQRAQIAMVYGTVEHLMSQGTKLEDAFQAAEWPFDEETMRSALPVIYDQLAAKGVTVRRSLPLV